MALKGLNCERLVIQVVDKFHAVETLRSDNSNNYNVLEQTSAINNIGNIFSLCRNTFMFTVRKRMIRFVQATLNQDTDAKGKIQERENLFHSIFSS